MDNPPREDDFREISDLLLGAKERYRTARARARLYVNGAVARESNRRFACRSFDGPSGGPGRPRATGKPRPSVPWDFHRRGYEDAEEEVLLWHERPDRWREEWWGKARDGSTGGIREAIAFGGRGGALWTYQPPGPAVHVPRVSEAREPDPVFAFLLDPSEEYFHGTLFDGARVSRTGRTATVAGREAFEAVAETISWDYPPSVFRSYGFPDGTTDHLFMVDVEVGTVLRAAARLEGREFNTVEVEEISYDEEFPEGTFCLERLPGVEFRRV